MVSNPGASIVCSDRLGEISVISFQAALDHFDLGEFVSAEPIRFGNFGQNVFLTSTTGKYVFRGAPHDAIQFPKERFFAELLHKHTQTPVPWPFHINDSLTIFKWAYVIMPCMPGKQFADPEIIQSLSANDWLSLAKTMGETVAEMQRYKSALEIPFTPNYVMQDLNISNITAEKSGAHWKITGIFDLVQSYFGNGEEDLIGLAILDNLDALRAYFAAYLNRRPARPGFAERMQLYLLCNRLKSWYWLNEIASPRLPKEGGLREWAEEDRARLESVLS